MYQAGEPPVAAVRSGNRPASPDGRYLSGQKGLGTAPTNHEALATSHQSHTT